MVDDGPARVTSRVPGWRAAAVEAGLVLPVRDGARPAVPGGPVRRLQRPFARLSWRRGKRAGMAAAGPAHPAGRCWTPRSPGSRGHRFRTAVCRPRELAARWTDRTAARETCSGLAGAGSFPAPAVSGDCSGNTSAIGPIAPTFPGGTPRLRLLIVRRISGSVP
jgi:hypothetical protein